VSNLRSIVSSNAEIRVAGVNMPKAFPGTVATKRVSSSPIELKVLQEYHNGPQTTSNCFVLRGNIEPAKVVIGVEALLGVEATKLDWISYFSVRRTTGFLLASAAKHAHWKTRSWTGTHKRRGSVAAWYCLASEPQCPNRWNDCHRNLLGILLGNLPGNLLGNGRAIVEHKLDLAVGREIRS
jgi:hypothetical protein